MEDLQNIQDHIYIIRGQRVMLDFDLATIYEVETAHLSVFMPVFQQNEWLGQILRL